MAVIHRGNEKLKEDLKQLGRVRVMVLLGALAAAAVCALLIVYAIPWLKDLLSAAAGTVLFKVLQTVHYICIGGLVLSVLCIIGSFGRREAEDRERGILKAGIEGEEKALRIMEHLPGSYHVYTNLIVPYNGKESETDMIVAGPTGVYIVEVKGHKGTITGDWSDENLRQEKDDRSRTVKTFYNPLKQVGTHVYRLSNAFRQQKISCGWIEGCVLFADDEACLNVTDKAGRQPHVYTYGTRVQLRDFITLNTANSVSHEQLNRIIAYLNSLL
ncbi:MAG: NERD domain-containing protein [Clostridia bacterium]|nr:NERD domain-containing protein [Clostridia bacterium]